MAAVPSDIEGILVEGRGFNDMLAYSMSTGDADNDHIPDDRDDCPFLPEDFDGWEDSDGCLDPDNDNDGIPNGSDPCPLDPLNDVDGDGHCGDIDNCSNDTNVDQAVRKDNYAKAIKRITEQVYWLPMFNHVRNYAYDEALVFIPYQDEIPRFWQYGW